MLVMKYSINIARNRFHVIFLVTLRSFFLKITSYGEKWSVLPCSAVSADIQNCNRNVKRRFIAISLFLNSHVEGTSDDRYIETDNEKRK
jgi:hypothetical protein